VVNKTGPGGKPRRYVTVFVFLDRRLHVIASCSCPDFKYRWEVALNRKQAAEIEYSNGELPVIRNPAMRATFCKHCLALFTKIESELPKPKRDAGPAVSPPEIGVPPSVIKKQEEERKAAEDAKKAQIKPVKISGPKNTNRSGKASKKQSTMPRPKPVPAPAKPATPPAAMKAPSKSAPVSKGMKPAAMKAPAPKAPKGAAPAMMKAPTKSAPVSKGSPPAMMRARK
jgi:hypothetical protein